jgi:hypothetical protein
MEARRFHGQFDRQPCREFVPGWRAGLAGRTTGNFTKILPTTYDLTLLMTCTAPA